MRINDEDILRIIKEDGPSVQGHIIQRLNIETESDRKKVGRKLRVLSKYGFVERVASGCVYIYRIPGDKRQVNRLEKATGTARDVFNRHVEQMGPNETITPREVIQLTDCGICWARRMLQSSGLVPVKPTNHRKPTEWGKGANQ